MKHVRKGGKMGAGIEKISIKIDVQKHIEILSNRRAEDGRPGIHGGDFGGSLLVRLVPYTVYQLYTIDHISYIDSNARKSATT